MEADATSEEVSMLNQLDRECAQLREEKALLLEALQFYADRGHFMLADEGAWDTVSGEPANLWCDEAGTATVEDGTIARAALAKVGAEK